MTADGCGFGDPKISNIRALRAAFCADFHRWLRS